MGFMQNFVTGISGVSDDGELLSAYGDGRVSYIDCADIAATAAVLLREVGHHRETLVLTGPEALSQAEIAEELSRAWQRPIRHVALSPGELAAHMRAQGLAAAFAADVAALCEQVARGDLSATTTAVRDLTGRDPRTFDEFRSRTGSPPSPDARSSR
jgi:uncharacterized protein YbjT (DUF2867 family)